MEDEISDEIAALRGDLSEADKRLEDCPTSQKWAKKRRKTKARLRFLEDKLRHARTPRSQPAPSVDDLLLEAHEILSNEVASWLSGDEPNADRLRRAENRIKEASTTAKPSAGLSEHDALRVKRMGRSCKILGETRRQQPIEVFSAGLPTLGKRR